LYADFKHLGDQNHREKSQLACIHFALLEHIILILSHPVFVLLSFVISGEAENINLIVFILTRMGFEHSIYHNHKGKKNKDWMAQNQDDVFE
jgi:hypothetical protein